MNFKKIVVLIGFFSLLLLPGMGIYAEQINIEKLNFDLGVKSLKQNELHEAIKYFELVLDKSPDNVEAHYNIAIAYKKLQMHDKALIHFNKVVELLNAPKDEDPMGINISKFRKYNKKLHNNEGEALERFDIYTEVKAKENDYVDLGDMHFDNKQYEAAVEYYNLALQINPYNDNTYFKVCRSYMELEDYLDAEPYIKRALELDLNNSRYEYYNDLVAQKIDANYEDVVKSRERLVKRNLNQKDPLADFEEKYYEKELFQDGFSEQAVFNDNDYSIDKASSENKKDENLQKERIKRYYEDKDKKEILVQLSQQGYDDFAYKQSQELDYLDLGDLHFDNREYETAVEYYNMALDINSGNDYTYYKLSRCYLELGEYEKADNQIKKALSLSGQNKKYVYFKNQINDKLADSDLPENEGFYTPSRSDFQDIERQDFYVDQIAQEPGQYIPEEPLKKVTILDKMKSAVSSIRMPDIDFKMPELSKLPGKIASPLEGKVEKITKRRQEKQQRQRPDDSVFNRPSYYYEMDEKHLNEDLIGQQIDERDFHGPMKPVEKDKELYSPEFYNERGIEFFKRNNMQKAEEYFQKAVQLKPMYARGYNNLANVEYERKNYEKAKEYALKSVEVDPRFPEGYYNLSLISKKQKDFDNEINYLNKAIAVDPKYYQAYFARGIAYQGRGYSEKAKYNFSEVLTLKNDHHLASQNLGILYANELNHAQAEKYLKQAIKLNRNNPMSYFYLGVVQQNSDKIIESIENYQKAIELDPSNYRAYVSLSQSYEKNSQPARALSILNDAAEKNPENPEIYNYLGLMNLKFDKYENALVSFKKAVDKNPNRPIYHYNLSQSYLCMSNRKESNFEFQRAVNIIPNSVQDYIDLAEIFYDRGMVSYAIQNLKDGIVNLPQNDYLYLAIADFYERTGAVKSAREILENYLGEKGQQGTFSLLVQKRLNKLEKSF